MARNEIVKNISRRYLLSTDWDVRFDEPGSGCKVYESAGLTLFGLKTLLDSFREHVYCVKLYTFCVSFFCSFEKHVLLGNVFNIS
ncbi:hypothetical protein Hanom_Chr16g01497671 [Helianthus anomalus]